ncbi:MAG: hypothetical protein R3E89_10390 [Thiolinea sp.]
MADPARLHGQGCFLTRIIGGPVDLFNKTYESEAFAKIQKEKGLFPLNMSGEVMDKSIKTRVARMRDLATEMGLIQQ